MIVFLHTAAHRYTHAPVRRLVPSVRQMSYEVALGLRSFPRATYVFTDMDRLSTWQLELAAHVYVCLNAGGCRLLNDPARVLGRLPLLRRLALEGLNGFDAWPASEAWRADRFPVFVRTAAAHRGNLTDLIFTPEDLSNAIERLLSQAYPLSNLIVVQYCAEASSSGVFRKLSMYKVGDALLAAPSVHERHWMAKYGEAGVAGPDGYEEDLRLMARTPYAMALLNAFKLSSVEYGRADFGIVQGKAQIYEINTNPSISLTLTQNPNAARREAEELSRRRYLQAIRELDSEPGPRVQVPLPTSKAHVPRRRRISPLPSWMP